MDVGMIQSVSTILKLYELSPGSCGFQLQVNGFDTIQCHTIIRLSDIFVITVLIMACGVILPSEQSKCLIFKHSYKEACAYLHVHLSQSD